MSKITKLVTKGCWHFWCQCINGNTKHAWLTVTVSNPALTALKPVFRPVFKPVFRPVFKPVFKPVLDFVLGLVLGLVGFVGFMPGLVVLSPDWCL